MSTLSLSNKKKKGPVITNSDLMEGWTSYGNDTNLITFQPLQTIDLEFKDDNWIKWNANWCERMALRDLPNKAKRLQRLYNLAAGIIDHRDYFVGEDNEFREHLRAMGVNENESSILDQFYSIIPNIIQVFLGENLKRDNKMVIMATDPESRAEQLEYKQGLVMQILTQKALQDKQAMLAQMGLSPEGPTKDQYMQEMQAASQLIDSENKFKTYRTIAEQWAQKFIDLFGTRNRFHEIELAAFADSLIVDECIVALDMREDSFTPEILKPMKTYVNISPDKKYYSEANFIVNTDFYSLPDIISKFRSDLSHEQVQKLETQHRMNITSGVLFDYQNGDPKSYYDVSVSRDANNMTSPSMKEEYSSRFVQDTLLSAVRGINDEDYAGSFDDPRKYRVSRIWWCSIRRIGLLTKKDGINPEPVIETVDENFLVTEEPEYDNSLLKDNTADNLIRGEHIDWKDVNEWRYVVKIGQNIPSWNTTQYQNTQDNTIFLYGGPVRFQFRSDGDYYDAKPPVEGCRFSNANNRSVSLVERMKPWQIMYNVLNNRAMQKLPDDISKRLLLPLSQMHSNSLFQEDGIEPVLEYADNIRKSTVVGLDDSREAAIDSTGRFAQPFVADMSIMGDIALYLQTAQFVKAQAYETVGVPMQRLGQVTPSESATGVQTAVSSSVNQTEIYFELFNAHFLPRLWNLIIEAGQYYTTLSPTFADSYLTADLERSFFEVQKGDLVNRKLFLQPQNTANVKDLMKTIKQLAVQDNTMGASFPDKVKVLMAHSPSALVEDLYKAEDKRIQQENQKYQEQQKMQEQAQQAAAEMKQQDMQFQDTELQKKLDSQERIAEGKNMNSIAMMPNDDSQSRNNLEAQKVQQQQDQIAGANDANAQKQAFAQQTQQDNVNLKREEMQLKREDMQNQLNIATQNKSLADIKFVQMQRKKDSKK